MRQRRWAGNIRELENYAMGGAMAPNTSLSKAEMFVPEMNTWTKITNMPTSRWGLATSTVNGKIYAIGGAPGGFTGLATVGRRAQIALIRPTPYALRPTPYALRPTPYALRPTPYALPPYRPTPISSSLP